MSQPIQTKFGLPNGDWCAIDNSAAPTFPSLTASTHQGYDTTAPGQVSQCVNSFGDTGSVLLDPVNDTVYAAPDICTVVGNPTAGTAPTFKTVTKVLTNPLSATILWKNPA
jgi:hypothetical protein